MRRIDYDKTESYTGNLPEYMATDEDMEKIFGNIQLAFEEGFAAADGVRNETAESGGRVKYPENGDRSLTPERKSTHIEHENPGLADN